MLQGEHSAILSTFIKLPFVIKIFVLSIFEWPFCTGFTVCKEEIKIFLKTSVLENLLLFEKFFFFFKLFFSIICMNPASPIHAIMSFINNWSALFNIISF